MKFLKKETCSNTLETFNAQTATIQEQKVYAECVNGLDKPEATGVVYLVIMSMILATVIGLLISNKRPSIECFVLAASSVFIILVCFGTTSRK